MSRQENVIIVNSDNSYNPTGPGDKNAIIFQVKLKYKFTRKDNSSL